MPKIREPLRKFGKAIKDRFTRTEVPVPVPGSQKDTQVIRPKKRIMPMMPEVKKRRTSDGYMKIRGPH